MTLYRILDCLSTDALESYVEELLKEGWTLQGGVASYSTTKYAHFTQAMTKEYSPKKAIGFVPQKEKK